MEISQKPEVSIIVPVYNVEKYVKECLESIASQTFTDWECIVVDDGATDRSGEICDEFANRDQRFKVLHVKNGGVASARNH
ncbi:MAG: glycosyltransferase, partial [Muribaculaceae bacterium]|nr:glycosyltransferase [Muribaculaceae bacterium]